MRRWVAAGMGLLSLLASAKPSCSELNELWKNKFARDFHIQWKIQPFECDPKNANYKLASALEELYLMDPKSSFYETLKNATNKTRFGKDCESETAAWMTSEGDLTLCSGFFSRIEETERRGALLFHEAAHARATDPHHETCLRGDMDGVLGACDAKFTENYTGSGYNWEALYEHYASEHAPNDLNRWLHVARLKYLLANRFNEISSAQLSRWEDD